MPSQNLVDIAFAALIFIMFSIGVAILGLAVVFIKENW